MVAVAVAVRPFSHNATSPCNGPISCVAAFDNNTAPGSTGSTSDFGRAVDFNRHRRRGWGIAAAGLF